MEKRKQGISSNDNMKSLPKNNPARNERGDYGLSIFLEKIYKFHNQFNKFNEFYNKFHI